MKDLIIRAKIAKLVALPQPIERTGTKANGDQSKTRTITHRLYLHSSPSLDAARIACAAVDRDDKEVQFALKQQQAPGYYVMDLDVNAIQVLAGSCGCPAIALPLDAPGQMYSGVVQIREEGDVVTNYRTGEEITVEIPHASVTAHVVTFDQATKDGLRDSLIRQATNIQQRNKAIDVEVTKDDEDHTADGAVADLGKTGGKVQFTFRKKNKNETPKQYQQATELARQKFNAKHDVKVS